jgi:type III secretion protein R
MNLSSFDPLTLVLILAGLSLLPMLLVCTTCFLKVSMVLVIVRNAIGVQQVPPSIAIYSIALAITAFVMAPVFREVMAALPPSAVTDPGAAATANAPAGALAARKFSVDDLMGALEPLRRFMVRNTLREHRQHFLAIARKQWPQGAGDEATDSDYIVLIPAFVVSELELAFEVGFVLYVPFVVIDLLLSNLLLALGMQMVSPMVVSLPLKMLLFVVLSGWTRLIDGLIASYA